MSNASKFWCCFAIICALSAVSFANVAGTSGTILFKPNYDGPATMSLNATGLSIGSTQGTANLNVSGNAIISGSLCIGTNVANSANLYVSGTLGFGIETITANTTLSGNSMVLADASPFGANIIIMLPPPNACPGRVYNIKKISRSYSATVISDFGIDEQFGFELYSSNDAFLPSISLLSSGTNWYALNGNTLRGRPPIASSNLVAWFKFDETTGTVAKDSSAFGKSGNLMNSQTFSGCTMSGRRGHGLFFDGTNDYIQGSGTTGANLTANFSIGFWAKPKTVTGGTIRIVGCSSTAGSKGWSFGFANNTLLFTTPGVKDYGSSPCLTADTWVHIIAAYGSSNDITFYTNGVFFQTLTHNVAMNPNVNDPLVIGVWITKNAQFFSGLLDDIRIYNKVLTASEISLIYNDYY